MALNTTYQVSGMTCEHCVASVTEELTELAGVTAVDVQLTTGIVTLTSEEPLSAEQVEVAVREAGYQLVL